MMYILTTDYLKHFISTLERTLTFKMCHVGPFRTNETPVYRTDSSLLTTDYSIPCSVSGLQMRVSEMGIHLHIALTETVLHRVK